MMNSPVLAEWEMQVRVSNNQQLVEKLRMERQAGSPRHLSRERQAGMLATHLGGIEVLGLARPSSLVKAAWNRIQSLFYHPPVAEEECA
jgi:hypothetical protein